MRKVFLLFTGTLIVAVGLLFFPECGSLPALFAVAGVVAVGSAIAFPVGFDIATVLGKHGGMGLVIGLLSTAFNVGNAVTPLIAGAVTDLFSLASAFYVIAIVILTAKVTCYYFASRWLEGKVK
jgi:predicted MFS family arabinose efflux permease